MAFTIENNMPTVGSIRWSNLNMQYEGTTYEIVDGYTNAVYAYWTPLYPNNLVVTNTFPTLGYDECLLFLNKNGIATTVPTASVVPGDLIVPGTVLANALAANTITSNEIAAGAITSSELASNSVTTNALSAGAVTANAIAANAIGATAIAANAVTADKIVADAVTTAKIASRAVTANEMATNTITAASGIIADAAITTAKIADGNITNAKIGALAVDSAKIADASVTTAKIANLAVTNAKIANATITNAEIANSTITGAKIAGATITDANIANATITSAKINSIDAAKITTGTLDAARIKIGSGTTFDSGYNPTSKQNADTRLDNLIRDHGLPYTTDLVIYGDSNKYYPVYIWAGNQNVLRTIKIWRSYSEQGPDDWYSATHKGSLMLTWKGNFGGWGGADYRHYIEENSSMYTELLADVKWFPHRFGYIFFLRGGGTTGALYHFASDQSLTAQYSGATLPSPAVYYNGAADLVYNSSTDAYDRYAEEPLTVVNTTNLNDITLSRNKTALDYANAAEQNAKDYRDLWAYPNTTLIDGGDIYTGTVTANKMAVGTITAASAIIADAAITTAKILDANVTNAKIANLAVDSAKIADASITNAKIGALAVDSAKLADASITNAKIANLAVTGAKMADATITNAKIADATIASAKIASLDAGKITTGTISADRIGANSITAQKIAIADFTNMCGIDAEGNVNGYTTTTISNWKYFKVGPGAYAGITLAEAKTQEFTINDEYYLAGRGYKEAAITGAIQIIARYYYTDGTYTNAGTATIPLTTTDADWSVNLKITADQDPVKTVSTIKFYIEKDSTTTGYYYLRKLELRKRYNGKLIVDGSIEANHIKANTITASKISSLNGLNVGNGNFVIDANGNVSLKGTLNGATGTFSGTITGSSFTTDSGTTYEAELKSGHLRAFDPSTSKEAIYNSNGMFLTYKYGETVEDQTSVGKVTFQNNSLLIDSPEGDGIILGKDTEVVGSLNCDYIDLDNGFSSNNAKVSARSSNALAYYGFTNNTWAIVQRKYVSINIYTVVQTYVDFTWDSAFTTVCSAVLAQPRDSNSTAYKTSVFNITRTGARLYVTNIHNEAPGVITIACDVVGFGD